MVDSVRGESALHDVVSLLIKHKKVSKYSIEDFYETVVQLQKQFEDELTTLATAPTSAENTRKLFSLLAEARAANQTSKFVADEMEFQLFDKLPTRMSN